MRKLTYVSWIFYAAGLYDGLLGMLAIFFSVKLFSFFHVTPPNHFGYVQFPGALLIVFAFMFFAIAQSPLEKRMLIPYGISLKISYVSVITWHWLFGIMPDMWKPFVICDIVFLALFIWAYFTSKRHAVHNNCGVTESFATGGIL